jgi:hypothetical protein
MTARIRYKASMGARNGSGPDRVRAARQKTGVFA